MNRRTEKLWNSAPRKVVTCQLRGIEINNRFLKLFAPILKWSTLLITKYEIEADTSIAAFAPEDAEDGRHWKPTYLYKQIMANRRMMDSIYFGRGWKFDWAKVIADWKNRKWNLFRMGCCTQRSTKGAKAQRLSCGSVIFFTAKRSWIRNMAYRLEENKY